MHVYRISECKAEKWKEFIAAMRSGNEFEVDEEMFHYWLGVLPPVFMGRMIPGYQATKGIRCMLTLDLPRGLSLSPYSGDLLTVSGFLGNERIKSTGHRSNREDHLPRREGRKPCMK